MASTFGARLCLLILAGAPLYIAVQSPGSGTTGLDCDDRGNCFMSAAVHLPRLEAERTEFAAAREDFASGDAETGRAEASGQRSAQEENGDQAWQYDSEEGDAKRQFAHVENGMRRQTNENILIGRPERDPYALTDARDYGDHSNPMGLVERNSDADSEEVSDDMQALKKEALKLEAQLAYTSDEEARHRADHSDHDYDAALEELFYFGDIEHDTLRNAAGHTEGQRNLDDDYEAGYRQPKSRAGSVQGGRDQSHDYYDPVTHESMGAAMVKGSMQGLDSAASNIATSSEEVERELDYSEQSDAQDVIDGEHGAQQATYHSREPSSGVPYRRNHADGMSRGYGNDQHDMTKQDADALAARRMYNSRLRQQIPGRRKPTRSIDIEMENIGGLLQDSRATPETSRRASQAERTTANGIEEVDVKDQVMDDEVEKTSGLDSLIDGEKDQVWRRPTRNIDMEKVNGGGLSQGSRAIPEESRRALQTDRRSYAKKLGAFYDKDIPELEDQSAEMETAEQTDNLRFVKQDQIWQRPATSAYTEMEKGDDLPQESWVMPTESTKALHANRKIFGNGLDTVYERDPVSLEGGDAEAETVKQIGNDGLGEQDRLGQRPSRSKYIEREIGGGLPQEGRSAPEESPTIAEAHERNFANNRETLYGGGQTELVKNDAEVEPAKQMDDLRLGEQDQGWRRPTRSAGIQVDQVGGLSQDSRATPETSRLDPQTHERSTANRLDMFFDKGPVEMEENRAEAETSKQTYSLKFDAQDHFEQEPARSADIEMENWGGPSDESRAMSEESRWAPRTDRRKNLHGIGASYKDQFDLEGNDMEADTVKHVDNRRFSEQDQVWQGPTKRTVIEKKDDTRATPEESRRAFQISGRTFANSIGAFSDNDQAAMEESNAAADNIKQLDSLRFGEQHQAWGEHVRSEDIEAETGSDPSQVSRSKASLIETQFIHGATTRRAAANHHDFRTGAKAAATNRGSQKLRSASRVGKGREPMVKWNGRR